MPRAASQTAVNGVYSLPDGTYSYAVMLDGYLNVAGSFTVAGKDLTVTVRLEEGSNVWTGKASDTAPETKTENGVTWYLIKTPEELAWFAAKVNGGETTINARIMVNLVLNSAEAPKANRWGGFGKYNLQYSGIFDGNGKTISGYYSCDNDDTYESAMGLVRLPRGRRRDQECHACRHDRGRRRVRAPSPTRATAALRAASAV